MISNFETVETCIIKYKFYFDEFNPLCSHDRVSLKTTVRMGALNRTTHVYSGAMINAYRLILQLTEKSAYD